MKFLLQKRTLSLVFALLFTLLFYKKLIGINLFLFELISISIGIAIFKPKFKSTLSKTILIGTAISCIMVIFHNSAISKFVNILSYLLLISNISFTNYKLIQSIVFQFFGNLFNGIGDFLTSFFTNKKRGFNLFYLFKIIGIPLLIIIFFLIIYYNSNQHFSEIINSFFNSIFIFFEWFPSISFLLILTFIIGLFISISIFYNKPNQHLIDDEKDLDIDLKRKRRPQRANSFIPLKNEYKSGVFLLIVLNLLLITFNYSDITTVWFSYNWNGGYLKEFVHSGTYLLIISLVVSIGIVLYYFRGNINFYKKNKVLRILTYVWMSQNLILVISLFIRNSIYIHHFALAYKRIGVFAFLIAVLVCIISIIIKVRRKKSNYYIIKNNTLSIYFIFIGLTLFNWDIIIAKYNLNSYDKSFIELNFLTNLSEKALPYIDVEHEKLNQIDKHQSEKFSFSKRSIYMNTNTYQTTIKKKIEIFKSEYPKRTWSEWNYSDYKAYHLLTEKN